MKKKLGTAILWISIILTIIFISDAIIRSQIKQINYTEFIQAIKEEKVEEINIGYDTEKVQFKYVGTKNLNTVNIPDKQVFLNEISEEINTGQVKLLQEDEGTFSKVIRQGVPILMLLAVILMPMFIIMLFTGTLRGVDNASNQARSNFSKSKARRFDENNKVKVTFDDVAGVEEEKEELEEIVDFLKNPKKYIDMGARIPKGVLLVGRPGTGKTLLAKAVAGEAEVPFYIISGSDFVEMFVGVGASRVRDLFDEAKKNAPCIIFIDEIDAVGRQRGAGLGGGHDEREQTLNQLLVEMDGFSTNEGVIVLAATNRPDVLDHALLRAGRFDRRIVVSMPDIKAREEILKVHSDKKKFAEDVDLSVIAKNTSGFAGSDLENLLNEAALLAARENKEMIEMLDVEEAMIKVSMGPEKKSKVMTDKEKRLVAFHEAGHAVVSYFLPTQEKVHHISIVPRGMAGGYTMYKTTEDKSFMSKQEMKETIISLLGGRVAEKIEFEDISTGASNDIERATKIARDMVTRYGMSDSIGTIHYGSNDEEVFLGRDISTHKSLSEKTAATIDTEVKNIIDEAYERALEILSENKDKLETTAEILLEKEKVEAEEFEEIMK